MATFYSNVKEFELHYQKCIKLIELTNYDIHEKRDLLKKGKDTMSIG